MKLKRFNKNVKQKKIIIGTIVGLIVLIGGITLYRTFALYEEKKEFNVLRGRIPAFGNYDIETLSIYLNNEEIKEIPSKGNYIVSIDCKNGIGHWDYNNWAVSIKNFQKETKCNVYFEEGIPYMSDYLIAQSKVDASIQKNIHEETVQTGANATIDYRFIGENPNNYICFGSEEIYCPEDNLYRIIGVIPTQKTEDGEYEYRVKVIKVKEYSEEETGYRLPYSSGTVSYENRYGYKYNNNGNSNWENSTLQNEVLNGVYWQNLGNYQNYIEEAKWYLGTNSKVSYMDYTPAILYKSERSSDLGYETNPYFAIKNIGLPYPSDAGYSAGESSQNTKMYEEKFNSWMFKISSDIMRTITPKKADVHYAMIITHGYVNHYRVIESYFVHPTFYLKSNVLISYGSGTIIDPYRISLN